MTPEEKAFEAGIIEAARAGDPSYLADALRADFPLSQEARDFAADLIEGRIGTPRKRGGQRDPGRDSRRHEVASAVALLMLSGVTLDRACDECANDAALPAEKRRFRFAVSESYARKAYAQAIRQGWPLPSMEWLVKTEGWPLKQSDLE
ncbi:MAG: hypothetical protein JNM37_11990 [Rhodocyclaceae bacterium]|nr:hypothetical protein [Rhodocyclaceae bacterium]